MENVTDFLSIDKAAEILKVSDVTARKLLGKPDEVIKNKYNLPVFLYAKERIEAIQEYRQTKISCEKHEKCRVCHEDHCKHELVGGRCEQCRADSYVANFCQDRCHFCKNEKELIAFLKKAIERFESGEMKCCCH